MTAFDLIDSIFDRPQERVAPNQRRITKAQLDFLEGLIGQDPEGGAYKSFGPYQKIWTPSGRQKFIIQEETRDKFRSITRLSSANASEMGRLF